MRDLTSYETIKFFNGIYCYTVRCWGFNCSCGKPANEGCDFCTTCYEKLKQRRATGLCTARAGKCPNRSVHGHSWCRDCYEKFKKGVHHVREMKNALDTHRGVCNGDDMCEECDYRYYCYLDAMWRFQDEQRLR